MFSAPPPPPASRRHSRLHSASLRLPRPLFKGVRKRSWGRWVSEIRVPHSRAKIWLGSYSMPELAARAYDAAYLILRGPSAAAAALNFPDSSLLMNPHLAAYYADCSAVTRRTIQIAAAAIANAIAGAEDRMLSPPASEEQALTERRPGNEDAQIDSAQEGEGLQGVVSMEAGWTEDALNVVSPIGGGSCATTSEDRLQEGPLDMEMLRSASSDELLLQALQAALIQDGFTPVSSAVTSRERFDTDVSCPFDPLWSYPS